MPYVINGPGPPLPTDKIGPDKGSTDFFLQRPPPSFIRVRRARKDIDIPSKLTLIDGQWVPDNSWSLYGRSPTASEAAAIDDMVHQRDGVMDDGDLVDSPPLVQDNIEVSSTTTFSLATPTSDHYYSDTVPTTDAISSASSTPTSSPTSIPTASSSSSTSTSSTSTSTSSAAASSFTIPAGWTAPKRQTSFYAVPVIIATSIILAAIVIAAITGSVLWRTKATSTSSEGKEGEAEKAEGDDPDSRIVGKRGKKLLGKLKGLRGPSGKRVKDVMEGEERVAEVSARASGRTRSLRARTRRTRGATASARGSGGAEDDEVTALTGNSSPRQQGGTPNFATRLASRFGSSSNPPRQSSTTVQSPTVFSRDLTLNRLSSHSLSTLSRTSSLASSSHSNLNPHPSTSRLSLNIASPSPSSPSPTLPTLTFFSPPSHFSHPGNRRSLSINEDVVLPLPGPPAYRPSGSSVQHVIRGSESRHPISPPPPSHPNADDEEWHWPGEKQPRRLTPRDEPSSPPPPVLEAEEEEDDTPAVERSTYAAHHATDDKAVLERLREIASTSTSGARRREILEGATAPMVEEEEVDEDGFERFDHSTTPAEGEGGRLPFPEPPRPIVTSIFFDPTSTSTSTSMTNASTSFAPSPTSAYRSHGKGRYLEEEDEEVEFAPLPVYYKAGPDVLAEASAPPPEDDFEEEEELEYVRDDETLEESREEVEDDSLYERERDDEGGG